MATEAVASERSVAARRGDKIILSARGEVASVPASRAAGSEMEAVAGGSGMNRGCIEL